MKIRLGRITSDIFLIIYIMGTLALRFYLEPQLNGRFLISLSIGVFALLFLWALIRVKVLNPSILTLPGEKE